MNIIKNMQLRHNGTFRYRDLPLGDVVDVVVSYDAGTKAIYVHITPRNVKPTETPGLQIETFSMFAGIKSSGAKIRVRQLTRKNQKALETVAAMLDAVVVEVAKAFRESPSTAFEMIKSVFEAPAII